MKRLAFVIALLAWGTSLGAAVVKLPVEVALPQGAGSPGEVTFRHETHVDLDAPDCTVCHPRLFRILKSGTRTPIVHARFDKGELCASCHDGKKSFAVDEDCSNCHRS